MGDWEELPPQSVEVELPQVSSNQKKLEEHKLWEGWSQFYSTIPFSSDEEVPLPCKDDPDIEVVGFAYPLPPVEFHRRRHPPPNEADLYREVFKLLHHTLELNMVKRSFIFAALYRHLNRNHRDSMIWQRAMIKAGCIPKLIESWKNPSLTHAVNLPDKYWVMAIMGRMMGTSLESRRALIDAGVVHLVLEGTTDEDPDVRECSIFALKGLVQHPEGRKVVSYNTLIQCLSS